MLALLPSLTALVLAFILKSAALALGIGALTGAFLVNADNPKIIPAYLLDIFIISPTQSPWKLGAIILTLQLGALSALLEYNGNLERVFRALSGKKENIDVRKRSLYTLALMGLFCFYDGLANSILLGRISHSLQKKMRVSREFLAYIVDTTSSSVACLVLFSTWTAYQLTLIQENIPPSESALGLLIKSVPYNIYSWLSLVVLFIVIKKNILIGPLKKAEEKASIKKTHEAKTSTQEHLPKLFFAVLPLACLFIVFILLVHIVAYQQSSSFIQVLASPHIPLLLNISASSAILSIFVFQRKNFDVLLASKHSLRGLVQIAKPCLILFSAWALSQTLRDLGLAQSLSQFFIKHDFSIAWLPAIIFISACLLSFFTGTSWGTFAIMMPLVLPFVFEIDPTHMSIAPIVVGAIFGGAVFGDHCSPLSDTTVVSSFATNCSVRNHVRTQIPYALITALLALAFFYIPYALWKS
jgi:tetracycline resistance efflux pump